MSSLSWRLGLGDGPRRRAPLGLVNELYNSNLKNHKFYIAPAAYFTLYANLSSRRWSWLRRPVLHRWRPDLVVPLNYGFKHARRTEFWVTRVTVWTNPLQVVLPARRSSAAAGKCAHHDRYSGQRGIALIIAIATVTLETWRFIVCHGESRLYRAAPPAQRARGIAQAVTSRSTDSDCQCHWQAVQSSQFRVSDWTVTIRAPAQAKQSNGCVRISYW